jgi:hypothetical protein
MCCWLTLVRDLSPTEKLMDTVEADLERLCDIYRFLKV